MRTQPSERLSDCRNEFERGEFLVLLLPLLKQHGIRVVMI